MDIRIMQIILEILIGILLLYIAFFKSYFTEKGKNLATKEDIKDITSIVEKVKNQLQIYTQSKISLQAEERNSLIEYYVKYHFWLNTIIDIYISNIDFENIDQIIILDQRISDAKFNYEIAEGRMELFTNNEELTALKHSIKIKTIELQNIASTKLSELKYTIKKYEIEKRTIPAEEVEEKHLKYLEDVSQVHSSFNDEKINKYREIVPINNLLQTTIYQHIENVIEAELA